MMNWNWSKLHSTYDTKPFKWWNSTFKVDQCHPDTKSVGLSTDCIYVVVWRNMQRDDRQQKGCDSKSAMLIDELSQSR